MIRIHIVKADLSRNLSSVELNVIGDLHIGDKACDRKLIQQRIDHIHDTENAYCILNGDLMNTATKTSVSDCYAERLSPMQEIEECCNLLFPIKDKIVSMQDGNHERRVYRQDGVDISRLIARELGIEDRYCAEGNFIFLRFGSTSDGHKETNGSGKSRMVCYTIYATHGSGGGRKEGSKINRLADMESIVDADVYIHSHTHLPMVLKESFFRADIRNSTVSSVDKLFVNTSACLNYGGYGQTGEFKPSSKDTPIIYLDGTRKKFSACL